MSWEQAALSSGISAGTALIGVGGDELGELAGGGLLGSMISSTTSSLGSTLLSGIEYKPGDGGWGWNGERMTRRATWYDAGLTAVAGGITEGIDMSDFKRAAINGVVSSIGQGFVTGDWGGSFKTGAIAAAGNYIGQKFSTGLSDGLGIGNCFASIKWEFLPVKSSG